MKMKDEIELLKTFKGGACMQYLDFKFKVKPGESQNIIRRYMNAGRQPKPPMQKRRGQQVNPAARSGPQKRGNV